jgi:hypothetical protein
MNTSASEHNIPTVTETNGGGYIAICECGWTTLVHRGPVTKKKRTETSNRTQYNIGKEEALNALKAHQRDEHADSNHAA